MLTKIFSIFAFIIFIFAGNNVASAQDRNSETAVSGLLEINLPAGAERLSEAAIPAEFNQLFDKVISAAGSGVKRGEVEVLVWTGGSYRKSKAAQLNQQIVSSLEADGWQYQVAEQRGQFTFFIVGRTAPKKRGFVGFWSTSDEGLILALAEMLSSNAAAVANNAASNGNKINQTKTVASSTADAVFNLAASDDYVNVMGSAMPKLPAFPALAKKPGKIRGYVKDLNGNPLEGAYIGIRSSAVGGYYSGADSETDANGYYEVEVPLGAAHFYAAGYTIDYGEGRAALGLHPADGKAGSFASAEGAVENFVLLYHGLGDRDALSEKPWDSTNYYGGALRISYEIGATGDMWASKGSLPENSEIEITLAPEGTLLDGTAGKTFVIRRKTGGINFFHINNLPVGTYRISARLTNGKPLKMIEGGYGKQALFGLKPDGAVGSTSLLFAPAGAKAMSGNPLRGNWKPIDITLKVP